MFSYYILRNITYYLTFSSDAMSMIHSFAESMDPFEFAHFLQFMFIYLNLIVSEPVEVAAWDIDPPLKGEDTLIVKPHTVASIYIEYAVQKHKIRTVDGVVVNKSSVNFEFRSHLLPKHALSQCTDVTMATMKQFKWFTRAVSAWWLTMTIRMVFYPLRLSMTFTPDATQKFQQIYEEIGMERYTNFLRYFKLVLTQILSYDDEYPFWGMSVTSTELTDDHKIVSRLTVDLLYMSFTDKELYGVLSLPHSATTILQPRIIYWYNMNPTHFNESPYHGDRILFISRKQRKQDKRLNSGLNDL